MTDTFGLTSYAPFATWDRDSSSWRTSEATSLWALTLSSLTLPTWGGLRNGDLYERPTPEPPTSALDCSSLPTPVADHSRGLPSSTTDYASLANVAASLLPTPAVNDMGRGKTPEDWDAWTAKMQQAHGNGNGHGKSLEIEALRMLPTPNCMDSMGARSDEALARAKKNGGCANLKDVIPRIGVITPPPSPDGSASLDAPLPGQLSLGELASHD